MAAWTSSVMPIWFIPDVNAHHIWKEKAVDIRYIIYVRWNLYPGNKDVYQHRMGEIIILESWTSHYSSELPVKTRTSEDNLWNIAHVASGPASPQSAYIFVASTIQWSFECFQRREACYVRSRITRWRNRRRRSACLVTGFRKLSGSWGVDYTDCISCCIRLKTQTEKMFCYVIEYLAPCTMSRLSN